MRILLTNDDGIFAAGLKALYRAVADLGEVLVVAPEKTQSGVGHGISVLAPMAARRVRVGNQVDGWAIEGRPADCVKLALLELLDPRPDFVISGINAGLNTGLYTLYSGTVAAAAEAAVFFGLPAMAVSLEISDTMDFDRAGRVARRVFASYAAARPPAGTCLNVNIPSLHAGWPRGVRVCSQSPVTTEVRYRRQTDECGRLVFQFDGGDPKQTGHPDSDSQAIRDRYVSITPMRFEATDQERLPTVSKWDWPRTFA
jgi:5'-nucleotidase